MSAAKNYDYIIAGAGCAGLSLLMHLMQHDEFRRKKILLVDKDAKKTNDRTWCFWEKDENLFESIVYKKWADLLFHAKSISKKLDIHPYTYKLIRGIDFYNHCLAEIEKHTNVTFLQDEVESVFSNDEEAGVVIGGEKIYGNYVFNSILFDKPQLKNNEFWLLQHFKGLVIQTPGNVFDPASGTLMDFRTDQSSGATFFYVLPFAPNRALVEYTIFSNQLLQEESYQKALEAYLEENLKLTNYTIEEEEFGVIPMSNFSFPRRQNNIVHIGTAGGQTKASSGYTFRFIQKQCANILKSLLQHNHPFAVKKDSRRFHFYDSILLHILHHNTLAGDEIFADLFEKNEAHKVLKFLDNETSLTEELSIISTLPTLPFLKAAIKQITT